MRIRYVDDLRLSMLRHAKVSSIMLYAEVGSTARRCLDGCPPINCIVDCFVTLTHPYLSVGRAHRVTQDVARDLKGKMEITRYSRQGDMYIIFKSCLGRLPIIDAHAEHNTHRPTKQMKILNSPHR